MEALQLISVHEGEDNIYAAKMSQLLWGTEFNSAEN